MIKKLKCVIFGYGYMGQIRHRTILSNKDTQLVGVYDPDQLKLKKMLDKKLIINKYKDVFNLDFDIAFICTPNNKTIKTIIDCLKKNKHTFCEKPAGRNFNEINKVKKYVKKKFFLKLMFGFNHRFHPAVLMTKKIIDSKKYGKIITMRGAYGKSGGVNFRKSWRNMKKISGGGILLDQGIHIVDLFRYFCGNFNKIKCFTSNKLWNFNVEDNAFLILKNKKNQLATLQSSSTMWRHTFRIEITLTKGHIFIEGFLSKTGSYGQEKVTYGPRQFENRTKALGKPAESTVYFDKDNSWNLEISKFVDYIKNNKKVDMNNFNDTCITMRMIEMAYRNSKKND